MEGDQAAMKRLLRNWVCGMILALSAMSAAGQSAGEWAAFKRSHNIPDSWSYNDWLKAGSPMGMSPAAVPAGPSAADIAARKTAEKQRQLLAEAGDLNQNGIDAYNRGDYETATRRFQEALLKLPDDAVIQENLRHAHDQIAATKQREQATFAHDKQEGLSQLHGIARGDGLDSGLRGIGSADSGLKGTTSSGDATGLKPLAEANIATSVVDACNVPTGLPSSVEDAIPRTPAGDRVRKGFQAIQSHDWKVALAWFQDALAHEPGDPGLQRLVELADYTSRRQIEDRTAAGTVVAEAKPSLARQNLGAEADKSSYETARENNAQTRRLNTGHDKASSDLAITSQREEAAAVPASRGLVADAPDVKAMEALDEALDDRMNEDLNKSLNDFYLNYLPKHPELQRATLSDDEFFKETDPAWVKFFRYLTARLPRQKTPTGSAAVDANGIRG